MHREGLGDALAQGFSLVVMPLLFGGVGVVVDRLLGTSPLFLLLLGVLGYVTTFASTWLHYKARAEAEDARSPWNRSRA